MIADHISKVVDYDDWMLYTAIFEQLNALWGLHVVDRFANYYNRQIGCIMNSKFRNLKSEVVDSFTVHWDEENNWWCLPDECQ